MTRDDGPSAASNGNARLYALVIVLALGGGVGGDAIVGRVVGSRAEAVGANELQRLEAHLDRRIDQGRAAADEQAATLRALVTEQVAAVRRESTRERELLARELQSLITMRTPPGLEDRMKAIERWIVRQDPTWGAHLNDPSVAQRWRAEAGEGGIRDSP